MAEKFQLIQRTTCAGCDVSPNDPTVEKLDKLFKECRGEYGWTNEKAIQLLFSSDHERNKYQSAAEALFVIFDSNPEDDVDYEGCAEEAEAINRRYRSEGKLPDYGHPWDYGK